MNSGKPYSSPSQRMSNDKRMAHHVSHTRIEAWSIKVSKEMVQSHYVPTDPFEVPVGTATKGVGE